VGDLLHQSYSPLPALYAMRQLIAQTCNSAHHATYTAWQACIMPGSLALEMT
jgi:hypothetical protein